MERNYKVSTNSNSNTDSQRWNPEPVVPGLVIHPFEEDQEQSSEWRRTPITPMFSMDAFRVLLTTRN